MRAFVRHVGVASQHSMDGNLHIEQRCRLSLVPDVGEAMPNSDEAQREIAVLHDAAVAEWLARHGYTRVELRKDFTTISELGEIE